jgi:hypothetical protein
MTLDTLNSKPSVMAAQAATQANFHELSLDVVYQRLQQT